MRRIAGRDQPVKRPRRIEEIREAGPGPKGKKERQRGHGDTNL